MKRFIFFALISFFGQLSSAQDVTQGSASRVQDSAFSSGRLNDEPVRRMAAEPVYKTSFKVDAPIIAAGVGLTYLGVTIIDKKDGLTDAEVAAKSKDDVPFFDKSSAGWYSKKIDKDSYIPFQFSFAAPVIMLLINKNERQNAGKVLVMYTETMGIIGTLFTMSAGLVERSRPLVYGTKASVEERKKSKNQRSFFAGHTGSSADLALSLSRYCKIFSFDRRKKIRSHHPD